MILPFSHDARMPGKQDALAIVDGACPVFSIHGSVTVPLPVPVDPVIAPLIKRVSPVINAAKVCYTVIKSIAVDVVYDLWLLPATKKVANTVSKILLSVEADAPVFTGSADRPGNVASLSSSVASQPSKVARFRVVRQDISNRVGYKFCSHAESLLSVVRGLTVGAVSTPILSKNTCNLNMRLLNG